MSYELNAPDLLKLAEGACFFGSGGGGTLVSARHLISHFRQGHYYPADTVRVVGVDEARDGDAVMVAYMGAPEALDKVTHPEGPVAATQAIQARLASQGRKLAYIVPPESGALGFVVACLVAARLGLAVVDADGAGRAVPSLPMLTFAAAGIPPSPAFLASHDGLCVELGVTPAPHSSTDPSVLVEQMLRPVLDNPAFGEFGGLAMWIMSPAQLADALPIRGTLQRALTLGRALPELETPEQLCTFLRTRFDIVPRVLIDEATLRDASVDTGGGFDLGKLRFASGDREVIVLYQNESLLIWDTQAGAPLAMAPDSITCFAAGPGQRVFSNGDMVRADGKPDPALAGRLFTVLALPAAAPLREKNGLILDSFMAEIAKLGYQGPYLPVTQQG